MKESQARLKSEIEKLPKSEARSWLIARVEMGVYDDFASALPMPKVQCVVDLKKHGFEELAKRVANGEFDDMPTKAESDELQGYFEEDTFGSEKDD